MVVTMHKKKVKIYGTLGPACQNPEILKQMFQEGMDGIRLNLSHTTLDEAADMIGACHSAASACGIRPELLIDMQGPELRIGKLREPIQLKAGDVVGPGEIPFPEAVIEALASGQEILLDDGKILLKVEETEHGRPEHGAAVMQRLDMQKLAMQRLALRCRVIRGGLLQGSKSVALPGCQIQTPAMTDRDRAQIRKAKEFGVTAVMQPFVRSKKDLEEVRGALDQAGGEDILLLAKIENMAGVEKLRELIPCCDEIVIARGDLGNAMELWELPGVQKRIAAICRDAGRDFMVVTQMLESMTHRQVPSRAEVSDIFNAVLDGAASVMVTGETAAGEYPVYVIRYLVKTVREAEEFK